MKSQRLRRIPLTCVVKSHSVLSKSRNRETNMRERGEKKHHLEVLGQQLPQMKLSI